MVGQTRRHRILRYGAVLNAAIGAVTVAVVIILGSGLGMMGGAFFSPSLAEVPVTPADTSDHTSYRQPMISNLGGSISIYTLKDVVNPQSKTQNDSETKNADTSDQETQTNKDDSEKPDNSNFSVVLWYVFLILPLLSALIILEIGLFDKFSVFLQKMNFTPKRGKEGGGHNQQWKQITLTLFVAFLLVLNFIIAMATLICTPVLLFQAVVGYDVLSIVALTLVLFPVLTVAPRLLYLCGLAGERYLDLFVFRKNAAILDPLPFQESSLRQLWQITVGMTADDARSRRGGGALRGGATEDAPSLSDPETVALVGTWGSGKSTILSIFQDQAQDGQAPAVVYFNAWRHQADALPEFSLYREIIQTWLVVWPYGWLRVPVIRYYFSLLPLLFELTFDSGVGKIKFGSSRREIHAPTVPRQLFWQECLRDLARAIGKRRKRLVVIVDDIDRCAHIGAQTYISLVRRFLSVDGVTIVVPFVREQLQFKAFRPDQILIGDLMSTARALILDALDETKERQLLQARATHVKDALNGSNQRDWAQVQTQSEKYLFDLAFSEMPNHIRERIVRALEEKYLYDNLISIQPIGGDDLVRLIERTPILASEIALALDLTNSARPRARPRRSPLERTYGVGEETVEQLLLRSWASAQTGSGPPPLQKVPAIRHIRGALTESLPESRLRWERAQLGRTTTPDDFAEFVSITVELAYQLAITYRV